MIIKRAFDILFSLIVISISMPIWLLIAIAIKVESKGPILYRSRRIGKNGIQFDLYKFRSMVKNADQIGSGLTVDGDLRLTRVGQFIRKRKIDELPNFLNVLIGQMSVVGPRPELPEFVSRYSKEQRKVLSVRPGITDFPMSDSYYNEQELLASVDNPHQFYINVILQDFLKMNLEYIKLHPSFLTDLKIIGRTLSSIFIRSSGKLPKNEVSMKHKEVKV